MALVILSTLALVAYGLTFGVDFRGGSVTELTFIERPTNDDLIKVLQLSQIGIVKDASITPVGSKDFIIKTDELSEKDHQALLAAINKAFPLSGMSEKQFDSVGPLIGNELKQKSLTAIIVVLLAISIYIAFVFRKLGGALSPWIMGVAAIIALIHDLIIPMGVFAWLGHYRGVEISAVFVAALLTILGYSISDSVVVFDRVRENLIKGGSREPFEEIVHRSIKQTLVRSINTNITTLLALVAIFFFGGESVRYFSLALIIGIVMGAFSSISVASPLLIWWSRRRTQAKI